MNNSKVRIYELAKELGRDNKDILEICAQLNISVKSHSSTITESQVEGIRAKAEKIGPSVSPIGKNQGGESGQNPGIAGKPSGSKQEILAVHRHNLNENGNNLQDSDALLPPPTRPAGKQALGKSPQPENNNPQSKLNSAKPAQNKQVMAVAPTKPALVPISETKYNQAKTEEKLTKPQKQESPQLVKPPARGKAETGAEKTDLGAVNKPVKKTEPVAPVKQTATPVSVGKKTEEGEKPNRLVGLRKPREDNNKPIPKLNKPVRPSELAPVGDGLGSGESSGDESDDDGVLELSEKPKLGKPTKKTTPPKTPKQKSWDEEDEEIQDGKAKPGKVPGTKNKRRTSYLMGEIEEDLEVVLDTITDPKAINLPGVRPPKPKAPAGTPGTATGNKKKSTSRQETKAENKQKKEPAAPPESIVISRNLSVRELAELIKQPETEIIKNLFFKGIAVNITQTLDIETARLVAEESGIKVETTTTTASAEKTTEIFDLDDLEKLQKRPPVVTIMGHVDHGKTTLLDSIRKTKVAQGEAGGITQHIGAYHVDIEHEGKKEQIVFLDTPGHEAFTAMRARGAKVTDIAVLVVAADDGVQPQTKEAVRHAQAAKVPIVVAINKIDKPDANPDRVKQELAELNLLAEDWGGDTIMVPVSALKGDNLDGLLEMLLIVAEIQELSANPDRRAKGTVIEANLDRSRGPLATLLVQNGTLRVGDVILAGSVFGKIRAMIDDRGQKVDAAGPSFAVEILGLSEVPAAGDEFDVFESEKEARALSQDRTQAQRQINLQQKMSSRRVTLTTLSEQAREGQLKELNLILKGDVQGSVEAIISVLQQLPQNEVQIRILLAAAGEVTQTDVDLAAASGAVIIGFNTTLASGARSAADQEGVDIREYNIIYKLLDDIQGVMEGLLDPEEVEEPLGNAQVRAVFPVGRGTVAGCMVTSGKVVRNRLIRVRRHNEVIYQGPLDSLKRLKEDAREVASGFECGLGCSKFNDWKEGDLIECYQMTTKRRNLSSN